MIARLTCDQTAMFWPIIRDGIRNDLSLPPAGKHVRRESNILEALLSGAMDAWVSYERLEEDGMLRLYYIVLASIYTDSCTKNRSLYLFSIVEYNEGSEETIREVHDTLIKYAKGANCHTITGLSNDDKALAIAKELGADISFRLVSLDITGG